VGENTSQIEREIVAERTALGRNLQELETRARDLTDWRAHHRNHPGLAVGLAFGAGMVLGLLTVPASTGPNGHDTARSDRDQGFDDPFDVHAEPPKPRRMRPVRAGLAAVGGSDTVHRARQEVGATWQRISDALMAIASVKAVEFVSGVVPGFKEHFERAPSSGGPHPSGAGRQARGPEGRTESRPEGRTARVPSPVGSPETGW
jgi:hypothetical protein